MNSEEPKEDLSPVTTYSERRAMRERKDLQGKNVYGGERCKCELCGDVHWKRVTNPSVETE